jgi:hypothetical protein
MNLQPINPPDMHGQVVTCRECGDRVRLEQCAADLDGPAFDAYYCVACIPVIIDSPDEAHRIINAVINASQEAAQAKWAKS